MNIVETMNTVNQESHNHSESFSQLKCLEEHKKLIYFANEGSGLASFSTDLGHIFASNVVIELGVMMRGKGPYCLRDLQTQKN